MKRPEISYAVRLAIFSILLLLGGRAGASVSIAIQPGDQTVSVGQNATFAAIVTATAGETITGYQWLMSTNNQAPFTIVGSAAALALNNVQTGDAGFYFVKVTYVSGGKQTILSSTSVRLTIDNRPNVVTQPASLVRSFGSNALFSVTVAGGLPLHFQWRHGGSNLADNGRIMGSTGTNLVITNLTVSDAGNYDIVVTNLYGSTTSQVATLEVLAVPPVINSPTNAAGKQGHSFDFIVTASGTTPITFGAAGLPAGLSMNSTDGEISGVPLVSGVFDIALFATNAAQTATGGLVLTLADDIPVITSATNATGKQGQTFSYTITATNDPVSFSASSLPGGLSLDSASGIISGVPSVSGSFSITIGATNAYGSDSRTLALNLASGVPGITGSLVKNGKQGQFLAYTIKATNNPASFSASPLPDGLNLDSASGVISGVPLVSGSFAVTVGVANAWGSDSRTLTLNLASGTPVITSSLTATAVEEQTNFSYTIKASNLPTSFWASDLPQGLMVNTNTGQITGIPLYAGVYNIPLFAANAWGVATTNLQLTVANVAVSGLSIANVITNYQSPYIVEFQFALRDGDDPLTSHVVVAPPALLSVNAFEDGQPVSPSETAVILQPVGSQGSKVLKGYLVLDFTESVVASTNSDSNGNGIPDAVDTEMANAQDFVNQQPADSQIGVYEFHRDDEAPQQVISLTTDKSLINSAIAGIWTNYVQDFPAGSRAWDALSAAIGSLGAANADESHYIVFVSDGRDESSTSTIDDVITAATNANVQIYGVGFGDELDANTLQTIADSTQGRYYTATDLEDLALNFIKIGKDVSGQYILRWATLKRSANSFLPSFQITYQGFTADSPTNPPPFISATNYVPVTNADGTVATNADGTTVMTNVFVYTTNYIIAPYTPADYAGNVLGGLLRLVPDADVHPSGITLRATYVPRFIRQLKFHYRANWPVSVSLQSTNPGEMLDGWNLVETNDDAGGSWAILTSPDPANLNASIPFASFGKLLTFSFRDAGVSAASNAFSVFDVDNSIYTNVPGTNFESFSLDNTNEFVAFYDLPPPHGTPIPWLMAHGFTDDFTNAELLDPNGNGLAVWQDYIAGLDPSDTNSTFAVQQFSAAPQSPPQIAFSTVLGRTYRLEWAASLDGPWTVLRDNIAGTGGTVTFTDFRDLSSVAGMFYRVAVY